jgi:hypothetical protein
VGVHHLESHEVSKQKALSCKILIVPWNISRRESPGFLRLLIDNFDYQMLAQALNAIAQIFFAAADN